MLENNRKAIENNRKNAMKIRDESHAEEKAFPIIPCNLCGSQDNLQRQVIKEMLQSWDKTHPGRLESIFRAMTDVVPSHLADRELFDFQSLEKSRVQALDVVNLS